jgi:hypothetical protein
MEFEDLAQRAMEVRRQYTDLEQASCGRAWTREEVALGFIGNTGRIPVGRRRVPTDVQRGVACNIEL